MVRALNRAPRAVGDVISAYFCSFLFFLVVTFFKTCTCAVQIYRVWAGPGSLKLIDRFSCTDVAGAHKGQGLKRGKYLDCLDGPCSSAKFLDLAPPRKNPPHVPVKANEGQGLVLCCSTTQEMLADIDGSFCGNGVGRSILDPDSAEQFARAMGHIRISFQCVSCLPAQIDLSVDRVPFVCWMPVVADVDGG